MQHAIRKGREDTDAMRCAAFIVGSSWSDGREPRHSIRRPPTRRTRSTPHRGRLRAPRARARRPCVHACRSPACIIWDFVGDSTGPEAPGMISLEATAAQLLADIGASGFDVHRTDPRDPALVTEPVASAVLTGTVPDDLFPPLVE